MQRRHAGPNASVEEMFNLERLPKMPCHKPCWQNEMMRRSGAGRLKYPLVTRETGHAYQALQHAFLDSVPNRRLPSQFHVSDWVSSVPRSTLFLAPGRGLTLSSCCPAETPLGKQCLSQNAMVLKTTVFWATACRSLMLAGLLKYNDAVARPKVGCCIFFLSLLSNPFEPLYR